MVAPLRVGLAGLGTVGAAVVDLIARERAALTARCGRAIEVTAVTARQKAKKRPLKWARDPLEIATDH
jgi:homoserine dehydrogenase